MAAMACNGLVASYAIESTLLLVGARISSRRRYTGSEISQITSSLGRPTLHLGPTSTLSQCCTRHFHHHHLASHHLPSFPADRSLTTHDSSPSTRRPQRYPGRVTNQSRREYYPSHPPQRLTVNALQNKRRARPPPMSISPERPL